MLSDCNCSFGNDTLIVHSRWQAFSFVRQRGMLFGAASVCTAVRRKAQGGITALLSKREKKAVWQKPVF